jgi:hypothetical protein
METPLQPTKTREGRKVMKSRFSVTRIAALALAVGSLFVLVGDRGLTATPLGIDPLEILNLQIKPNVLIVLDTSGSMNQSLGNTDLGADHPLSKMGSAKRVLKNALLTNESKVNMMFGTYTNSGSTFQRNTIQANSNNQDKFSYWATSTDFPSMLTTELQALQIFAFQIIGNGVTPSGRTNNNQLYFTEDAATDAVCTATVPAGFYQSGAALATAMQTAMNAATCTGVAKVNTYTVSWNAPTANAFTFTRAGARNFRMDWSKTPNAISAALNSTGTPAFATSITSGDARIRIMRRTNTADFTEGTPAVTYYRMDTGRYFNGETFRVQSNGNVCNMTVGAPSTTLPYVNLQLVTGTTCPAVGAEVLSGTAVRFDSSGGTPSAGGQLGWGGNTISCTGFQLRGQLRACDNTTGQATAINTPFLEPEWQIATTTGAAPAAGIIGVVAGGLMNREETVEGVGRWDNSGTFIPPYGLAANGSTPIANTLSDLKQVFRRYYNGGGAPPATVGTVTVPTSGQISLHQQPRERTIVLFITDGDDTCAGGANDDANALLSAVQAKNLYTPIVGSVLNPSGQYGAGTDPASSVVTYLVGYGSGAQVNRLNWIAWGGSGMQVSFATAPTAADRILCQTCQDAYVAPDPASLAAILQSIFDQGAQSGEFTAQQSISDSIYEYVDQAGDPDGPGPLPAFSATLTNRYDGVTPVRFISSFTLPGFNGQLKAYVNNGAGQSVMLWSAGDKLTSGIAARMTNAVACPITGNGGQVSGECLFTQLHAGATDSTIGTSSAAIRRRIYTTSQNGYFGVTVANLTGNVAPFRISLWPPQNTSPAVAPAGLTQGLFDRELGLPLDSAASPATEFTNLQNTFRVCRSETGSIIPSPSPAYTNCVTGTALVKMQQARKEAREIILAYMAGATPVIDSVANPKRVTSGANIGAILYKPKPWALGESSLATAAVVGPPLDPPVTPTKDYRPAIFKDEYDKYVKGPGTLDQGFGLRIPTSGTAPVMTVVYAGANDMMHAFRAGTSVALGANRTGGACGDEITVAGQRQMTTALTATPADCGGDELWGFVPYDQLGKLYSRFLSNPPKRDPHDYMIARGVRFSDVFVPDTPPATSGVWRKVIYFGRGIGGKYLTAIDVTAPGEFTRAALATNGPIPLWSRGNPDTTTGLAGGPTVNNAADLAAYATMGQTWSIPAVAYVDKTANVTPRRSNVDFALYVGSGYGAATEGTRIYTLDALTGDVVASADVETVAAANGLTRTGASARTYSNAIVANPIVFNPVKFDRPDPLTPAQPHPAAGLATRVYVADLYGRLWKLLTASPSIAIPMADLEDPSGTGAHQPVGTAASLIGLPADSSPKIPYIYVTSGNDNRESGPFRTYGFRDDGTDIATAVSPAVPALGVRAFPPTVSVFTREFDPGPVVNAAAPTPYPVFRGQTQPATSYAKITTAGVPTTTGVAFFVGTRFNPPLSAFAPLPVPGSAATYPCRSTFDSIVYAVSATNGAAAYDLNATGDDAYTIFRDSRIVGITTQTGQGQTYVVADQGLVKPGVQADPPPPPGVPPQTITNTSSVRMTYRAGAPTPAVRFGSSVCQM